MNQANNYKKTAQTDFKQEAKEEIRLSNVGKQSPECPEEVAQDLGILGEQKKNEKDSWGCSDW